MKNFAQLKQEVRDRLWPSGDPENLAPTHDKMVVEALLELQQLVDCLQYNNSQLVPACSTLFQSGMTVFDAPRGIIRSVHVVDRVTSAGVEDITQPLDWPGRILYRQVGYPELEKTALGPEPASCRNLLTRLNISCNLLSRKFPAPTDADYADQNPLPLGHHYSQASTDSSVGRALTGVWATHRGRIYVFPWIQSTETVIIEWDGIKRSFEDDDVIIDDPLVASSVALYVEKEHARLYDADYTRARDLEGAYRESIGRLALDCREETRVRERESSRARQYDSKYSIGSGSVPVDEVSYEDVGGSRVQGGCPSVVPVSFYPTAATEVGYPTRLILSSSGSGTIRYTANGKTPTKDSPIYVEPIMVLDGMVVKAALFDAAGCASPVNYSGHGSYTNGDVFDFYRLCTREDKAGPWHVFEGDGGTDWNWRLKMSVSETVEIKRVEIWQTNASGEWASGQVWSTKLGTTTPDRGADFNAYPLVVYSDGDQINYSYVDSLGYFTSDIEWNLYGQTEQETLSGQYFLIRVFTDLHADPVEQLILADACGKKCCDGRCGTITQTDDFIEIELSATEDSDRCSDGGTTDPDAGCLGSDSRTVGGSKSTITTTITTTINGHTVTLVFKLIPADSDNGTLQIWALDSASSNTADVSIEGWTSSTDGENLTGGKPDGSSTVYLEVDGESVSGNVTVNGPDICFTTTTTTTTTPATTSTTTSTTTTTTTTTTPTPPVCGSGETLYAFSVTPSTSESLGDCSYVDTNARISTEIVYDAYASIYDTEGAFVENASLNEVSGSGFGTRHFQGCVAVPEGYTTTWTVAASFSGCRFTDPETFQDSNESYYWSGSGLPSGDLTVEVLWNELDEELDFI